MSSVGPPSLILAAALSVSTAYQAPDAQSALDEAKALYRDARFTEAVSKLHDVVVALALQAHVPEARELLIDAHLHMALCQVALDAPSTAKESFKDVLRLNPDQRLDPDVYAPRVVNLFSEARGELALERPPSESEAEAQPEVASGEKKGGSKAVPILLGVGAAAGVAVAAGGGGGGDSAGPASAGASPTPTPTSTPTPTLGASDDMIVESVEPPAGSTLVASNPTQPGNTLVTIHLLWTLTGMQFVCAKISLVDAQMRDCAEHTNIYEQTSQERRGHNVVLTTECPLPVDIEGVRIRWAPASPDGWEVGQGCLLGTPVILDKFFPVPYRLVP